MKLRFWQKEKPPEKLRASYEPFPSNARDIYGDLPTKVVVSDDELQRLAREAKKARDEVESNRKKEDANMRREDALARKPSPTYPRTYSEQPNPNDNGRPATPAMINRAPYKDSNTSW